MKTKTLSLLLATSILIISCDRDPCDEGYTQIRENGTDICLPDYIVGIELNTELGSQFYHKELGVITYKDGIWIDEDYTIITDLDF